jgi:hypothetical protein
MRRRIAINMARRFGGKTEYFLPAPASPAGYSRAKNF